MLKIAIAPEPRSLSAGRSALGRPSEPGRRMPYSSSVGEWREVQSRFRRLVVFGLWQRDEAFVGEIAIFAGGLVAHEFRDVLLDPGDHPDVGILHVEEQRARHLVLEG